MNTFNVTVESNFDLSDELENRYMEKIIENQECNNIHPDDISKVILKLNENDTVDVDILLRDKNYIAFERIARITGYLSKTSRWNDSKKAELKDRVKHA